MVDEPVRIGNWTPENYRPNTWGPSRSTWRSPVPQHGRGQARCQVGRTVAAIAQRLGIVSALSNDASLALGTSEVTLLELAPAFVPFSNGGYPVSPFAVTRIRTATAACSTSATARACARPSPTGSLRHEPHDARGGHRHRQPARLAGSTWPARPAPPGLPRRLVHRLHRGFVAAVWVGKDDNTPTKKVTGGLLPAEIWRNVMESAHRGLTPRPLPGEPLVALQQEPSTISEVVL